MSKANYCSGTPVRLVRTGSPVTDGLYGVVIGVAARNFFDTYIVMLADPLQPSTPDFDGFGAVEAVTMPEQCLTRL